MSVVRLRALRRVLWLRETWREVPASSDIGVITDAEVDRLLADRADELGREAAFFARDPEAASIAAPLAAAEARLAAEPRWRRLVARLKLDAAERSLLLTAVALALEPPLARVFAYLHDQPEMAGPTPWLATALFGSDGPPARLEAGGALDAWGLVRPVSGALAGPRTLCLADPAIAAWLAYGGDADLPGGTAVAAVPERWPVLYSDALAEMQGFVAATRPPLEIEIAAPFGSGRRVLAAQLARACRRKLLVVDAAALPRGAEPAQVMRQARRAARLRGAMLYWICPPETGTGEDMPVPETPDLAAADGVLLIGRTRAAPDGRGRAAFRSVSLPALPLGGRLALWSAITADPPPRQIREWLLSPADIGRIRLVAGAGDAAIAQACRRPSAAAELLQHLPLPFARGDLVLPAGVLEQIDDLERQIRLRWDVYEEWGFDRLCPNGRGIVALFAGPPGTGKTMAAQVLARTLGLDLYRLDAATVVNKFIGETEKRLKLIFDECDRSNMLLLIDECEGLFGQRFSSKDAHDRYANLEIDYLLQRLERFDGVAILTTNRKNDVDPAFQRRLRMIVDFLPPEPHERRRLWRHALDADSEAGAARLEDIDWDALGARINMTGAEIKLTALNAAFLARAAGGRIGMAHVLAAARRELAKKGQSLRGFG